jgi:hypothetical protein
MTLTFTPFDYVRHFAWAAMPELSVISIGLAVGLLWPRDNDNRYLPPSITPRGIHILVGMVGVVNSFYFFGQAQFGFYDAQVRRIMFTFALFLLIPIDQWVALIWRIVSAASKIIVNVARKGSPIVYRVVTRVIGCIYAQLRSFVEGALRLRRALGGSRRRAVFLSSNLVLLVGGAAIGLAVGVTYFHSIWDREQLSTLVHSTNAVFILVSLTLIYVRIPDLAVALDTELGTDFERRQVAFFEPLNGPLLKTSELIAQRFGDFQKRRQAVRDVKAKARVLAIRQANTPPLKLVAVDESNIQIVSKRPGLPKSRKQPQAAFLKRGRRKIVNKALQFDLFAEPWDGRPATLHHHIRLTYPGQTWAQAITLALAAYERRLRD